MLEIKNIYKSYQTAGFFQTVLKDVSIDFRENEFVAILGPSGSGKTTLLNIIGGLDQYDKGDLVIDNRSTKKYKDKDWDAYRNNCIGFIFQSYNLIPHQTILENVELALTLSGVNKSERRKKAIYQLERVGLKDHINKKPSQLSGGQMQRVAIARALINDPEILLADEPTGALDTKTSVQIMDLLKEIANDKLVIMVTHNPELAHDYANRIVTLQDGVIKDDTNPIDKQAISNVTPYQIKHTRMSYFTALALSFKNLLTKKGRTMMTSFAGSIGIIGIAAILALSNGANLYIQSIEEDTLSQYPLEIEKSGMDITSMMTSMSSGGSSSSSSSSDSDSVGQTNMISNFLSRVKENDLKSLKTYIEKNQKEVDKYASSVEYQYDITPQIYLNTEETKQVNPNKTFSNISLDNQQANQSFSMMTSYNVFNQLNDDLSVVSNQYEVVKGKWPKKQDELLLVLNSSGKVSDTLLYTMGLRDTKELEEIVSNSEKKINNEKITYQQIMNTTFKYVYNDELYTKDDQYNIYVDKSSDQDYMRNLVSNGKTLKIVGIVKAKDSEGTNALSTGIYYNSKLVNDIVNHSNNSQVVKDQLATPSTNVFTGKSFDEENTNDNNLDLSSIFTFNGQAFSSAISIDQSAFNTDISKYISANIDTSSIAAPNIDTNQLTSEIVATLPTQSLTELMNKYMIQYSEYLRDFYLNNPTGTPLTVEEYFAQESIQQEINQEINKIFTGEVQSQTQAVIQKYMQTTITSYTNQLMQTMTNQIQSGLTAYMKDFQGQLAKAIKIDPSKLQNMISLNKTPEELSQLMASMMTTETSSYDGNLKKLGYADYNNPAKISIYPKNFDSKESIINILDTYNDKMKKEDTNKVITYVDLVGTLMTSVTDIINMISTILIAFVAISLVVSSIMIGVITYISVLERKKEIGILRAIGASKKDISHVFNAETVIIGFVAGVMGIAVTLLISIPANIIVENNYGVEHLVNLPFTAAIILIVISVFLTLLGGFIPARSASKSDPVEALRSE